MKLWDRESGKEMRTFRGHTDQVTSAAFSPDGRQILSVSRDDTVKLWDRESGQEVVSFVSDAALLSCGMDGELIIAGDNRGQVYRLRLHSDA